MKKLLFSTVTLLGALFLGSCTSIKTIVVEIEKPAQITLPRSINNIAIANNAIPQSEFWGHIEQTYSKKGEKINNELSAKSDSSIIILSEALFNDIINLNSFDNVSLYEIPIRNDLNFLEEYPIDSLMIKEICEITNTDAVVSIDRFLCTTLLYEEPFDFETSIKSLDLKMDVRFRIYSKEGKRISAPFYITDSIYWSAAYKGDKVLSENTLPSQEEAIKEGAGYMAEKIANSLIPKWSQEIRTYFGENKEANKKIEGDKWKDAIDIWERSFDKEEKPKKKARLANNIAVGYELSDNIKEAIKWIDTAIDLFGKSAETFIDRAYLQMASEYKERLLQRYSEFRVLDIRN